MCPDDRIVQPGDTHLLRVDQPVLGRLTTLMVPPCTQNRTVQNKALSPDDKIVHPGDTHLLEKWINL